MTHMHSSCMKSHAFKLFIRVWDMHTLFMCVLNVRWSTWILPLLISLDDWKDHLFKDLFNHLNHLFSIISIILPLLTLVRNFIHLNPSTPDPRAKLFWVACSTPRNPLCMRGMRDACNLHLWCMYLEPYVCICDIIFDVFFLLGVGLGEVGVAGGRQ